MCALIQPLVERLVDWAKRAGPGWLRQCQTGLGPKWQPSPSLKAEGPCMPAHHAREVALALIYSHEAMRHPLPSKLPREGLLPASPQHAQTTLRGGQDLPNMPPASQYCYLILLQTEKDGRGWLLTGQTETCHTFLLPASMPQYWGSGGGEEETLQRGVAAKTVVTRRREEYNAWMAFRASPLV